MNQARVAPFDQRQRYEVVAELVASLPRILSVLDVGGFYRDLDDTVVLPIRAATPHCRTVTVDLECASVPGYALADGTRLPFANAAFDVVSCLDVLEHVPRERRATLVAELFRVSRGYVALAMPVADEGAAERERALQQYITAHLATEQQQLREHAEYGMPTDSEVRGLLPSSSVSFGYGNLDRWAVMMFAKYFLLGVPHNLDAFYALDTEYEKLSRDGDLVGPYYRRFYVSAVSGASEAPLGQLEAKYAAPRGPHRADVDEVLNLVFDVLVRHDPERLRTEREVAEHRADHFERALGEARTHVENLEERGRHLDEALDQAHAHVRNLERALADLEKSAVQSAAHIANLERARADLEKDLEQSGAHIANLERARADLERAAQDTATHVANLEQVQKDLNEALEGAHVHVRNLEAGHRAQVAALEQTIAELREVIRQVEASKVYRIYRLTQRLSGAGRRPS